MDDRQPVFVDTSYLFASTNRADQWHPVAVRWRARLQAIRRRLITTEYVLIEFADGLADTKIRPQAVATIDTLRASDVVEIVPTEGLFDQALALYRSRPDKGWSLTDCASFAVMEERRLTMALSADHHFRQAGFAPLLLDRPNP